MNPSEKEKIQKEEDFEQPATQARSAYHFSKFAQSVDRKRLRLRPVFDLHGRGHLVAA